MRYRVAPLLLALLLPVATSFSQESPIPEGAQLELLLGNLQFGEGPVWYPEGPLPRGVLLYSELDGNGIRIFEPQSSLGPLKVRPGGTPNGLALDARGRLLMCRLGAADLARVEADGSVTTLASDFEGVPFNGPNDLTVSRDGTIYFTDPNPLNNLFDPNFPCVGDDCVDAAYALSPGGHLSRIDDDFLFANGITLSPDERRLYVNSAADRIVYVYEQQPDGTYANRRAFAAIPEAFYLDGMKTDQSGRLYVTGGGGLWIFAPDGTRLDFLPIEGSATNLNWGGPDYGTLYITSVEALYRLEVDAVGAVVPPRVQDERAFLFPGMAELQASSTGAVPESVALHAAYPNPVVHSTTIPVEVRETTHLTMTVYDVLGRTVAVLVDGPMEPGIHALTFDAAHLPVGVFLVRMTTGEGEAQTQRLTVVR